MGVQVHTNVHSAQICALRNLRHLPHDVKRPVAWSHGENARTRERENARTRERENSRTRELENSRTRELALDVALANQGGYWKDGSDFNLHLSRNGRFQVLFHDVNEGLRSTGRAGGPGSQPDPLVALDDTNKALRHKLLAVPALRDRYLTYIGDIAENWLDWNRLGPMVEAYRNLIADDIARDTRKHDTEEAFHRGILGVPDSSAVPTTIKGFTELRRAALLSHPEIVRTRRQ